MTTVPEKASFSVVVHPFDSPTPQACAYEHVTPTSAKARHALVFIGGLTDGPHTVPCVRTLAQRLAQYDVDAEAGGKPALGYSVFELRMSSSFYSYGIKRLADDVADLSALVKHLREQLGRQKIVFLGHSTGCQDSMSYAKAAKDGASPAIDGYILQGPVSDRECIVPHMKPGELERMLTVTERMIREGRENAIVPAEDVAEMIDLPHTAYRLHSLVAFNGDDDFFSTDLPDERLASSFGVFTKPLLVLPSEKDECVPETIDVPKNVARWKSFCLPGVFSELSASIPGANHCVDQPEAQIWLADRVNSFLGSLE